MRGTLLTSLVLIFLALIPAAAAQDPLTRAMQDELARSMEKLELEELAKPYFISYRIDDVEVDVYEASMGSLVSSNESRQRVLNVVVRVGDYSLDNTNFLSRSFGGGRSGVMRMFGGRSVLPVDDDYDEIRRQIWLATDGVYKTSVESFSKKRAALKNRTLSEELPDFSEQEPATVSETRPRVEIDRAAGERLVEDISRLFRELPELYTSSVVLQVQNVEYRYLNSEGSSYTRNRPIVMLSVRAGTQAADGMPLHDFLVAYGRSLGDLPSAEELAVSVSKLGARLVELRNAPLIERYNGPVLFEGQAAAELLAQAFAPKLLAQRLPVTDDPRMAGMMSQMQSSFVDKIGARVLPRTMSVTDDPTLETYGESVLVGGYKVDDEGVPAGPTKLIERGLLKTLLSDRNPVAGVAHSTGNSRRSSVLPSNVVVKTDQPVSPEELRKELMLLVQDRGAEYGILVRRLANPMMQDPSDMISSMMSAGPGAMGQSLSAAIIEAYRVYPDGREELIRNAQLSDFGASALKEIVAASPSDIVYSSPFFPGMGAAASNPFAFASGFGSPGQGAGSVVSWVVPSLLFEDLTIKKPSGQVPNPPVVPHPARDRGKGARSGER
ncbi:MAG: metallopeptidase TldD-related protein [Acidobacteriota bacterium]|nr:metallopeptidase TldD-related protein [Acidobacteriota bacterium]